MICRAVSLPGDGSRDAQLSAQLFRRMRCKREASHLTAAFDLDMNKLPFLFNDRGGINEPNNHLRFHTLRSPKPANATPRAALARRDNQNGICFSNISQPKLGIELCTANAPLKVRGLLLHIVRHSDEPCRARSQAGRAFDLFPIGRTAAALARQIHNFHVSASYSSLVGLAVSGGLAMPEKRKNKP